MWRSSPSDVLSACVYMADLPTVVGFNIYQKFTYTRYFCNIFTRPQIGARVPRWASATARLRWLHAGQAIVRTDEAGRDRSSRRALALPCPANPQVIALMAAADRAAPRDGNGGSAGCAR